MNLIIVIKVKSADFDTEICDLQQNITAET